jgi:hypothetical protein
LAYLSLVNWLEARAQRNEARTQAHAAKDQEKLSNGRAAWLQEMQVASGRRSLSRTLGEIALGNASQREILFQRLSTLKEQLSDDTEAVKFFTEKADRLAAIQRGSESGDKAALLSDFRDLQRAELELTRSMRERLKRLYAEQVLNAELIKAMERQRKALFETVEFCASRIVAIAQDPNMPYHAANPFLEEFWVLYWGEMGLVEKEDVESAMYEFGVTLRAIDDAIIKKIRSGQEPASLKELDVDEGFTPRQAIQSYYDSAKSWFRSKSKVDPIMKVGLNPQNGEESRLLEELKSHLVQLKEALEKEKQGPIF